MSPKILLVDDNEDLLTISSLILKAQGYTVVSATTLAEAAAQVILNPPALLLLDVCLGQEDGLSFCRQLQPKSPSLRIILMSGHELKHEDWCGAHDFLLKPFDVETLLDKVAQQLGHVTQLKKSA